MLWEMMLSVPPPEPASYDTDERILAAHREISLMDEIVPASDPGSRTQLVKISLDSRPGLRTGTFGRALFTIGEREALLVPAAALVRRGQLVGVFVLDEKNVARYRLVTTGATFPGGVEILSGLGAGEKIVVAGAERVIDGSRVE